MASSSWHLSLSDFDKIIVNFCHHGLKAPAIQIIIKCKLGIESELSHQDTVRRQMRAFFYLWQPTLPTRFPISDNNTGRYIALGETSQEHLNRMMLFTEQEIDAIKHLVEIKPDHPLRPENAESNPVYQAASATVRLNFSFIRSEVEC